MRATRSRGNMVRPSRPSRRSPEPSGPDEPWQHSGDVASVVDAAMVCAFELEPAERERACHPQLLLDALDLGERGLQVHVRREMARDAMLLTVLLQLALVVTAPRSPDQTATS